MATTEVSTQSMIQLWIFSKYEKKIWCDMIEQTLHAFFNENICYTCYNESSFDMGSEKFNKLSEVMFTIAHIFYLTSLVFLLIVGK